MFELTDRELQRFGTLLVNLIKKKLKEKIYPYGNPNQKGKGNKYASGQLYNSLTATVIPGQNDNPSELVITYQDYFKYVNEGRPAGAKKVPIFSLLQWIKIRGLKLSLQAERKGLAYAINRNREKKNKHKLPLDVLTGWIEDKNIRRSADQNNMSLAFAIQQSIYRYGIRPVNIYDKALQDFPNVMDNLPVNLPQELKAEFELLINAVAEDVNQFIDRSIDKEIKTIELE
jgi:hypothetical protein